MALRLKLLAAASVFFFLAPSFSQPAFTKKRIVLTHGANKKTLTVEVAVTEAEHRQGLMHRKSLPQNQGMLFVFNNESVREFWMKNTFVDLDIAYFNKERKIIDIQQMPAQKSVMQTYFPSYPSRAPAQYALEMNEGWFKKNKFPEGTKFEFASGPLAK